MWLFRNRQENDDEGYDNDDDDEEYEDDEDDEADDDYSGDDSHRANHRVQDSKPDPSPTSLKSRKENGSKSEQISGDDSAAESDTNVTQSTEALENLTVSETKNGAANNVAIQATQSKEVVSQEALTLLNGGQLKNEPLIDTSADTEESAPDDDDDDVQDIDGKGSEEEEEAMSAEEKQGLLTLAAEHDRVDIIKSILTEQEGDRFNLLHSGIPPLHTAVSFGSTNATQCLLRMGADPSIRPNVAELKAQGVTKSANVNRYDGVSAWELAFGRDAVADLNGDSTRLTTAEVKRKYGAVKPVNMAPSKREGIRHAFTAEALRCIGADEASRLEQLLKSGMPADTDIGGKKIYDWAMEMGALQCQKILRPVDEASQKSDLNGDLEHAGQRSAVLDRTATPGEESVLQLLNRLVELDSLARALSACLDNLAEEVSVCHGLLLMGGGASALAAHVRSLKDLQARQSDELDRCLQEWEECEDELAYWLREAGDRCDDIKTTISPIDELTTRKESYPTPQGPEEEASQRRQLLAQIAASEHKVRKLRASISDLSEENTRDLKEVERRGLTGGIKLVRGLREKLREIEFHQAEAKNGIASCRAKIGLIQSRLQTLKSAEKNEPDIKVRNDHGDEVNQASRSASGVSSTPPNDTILNNKEQHQLHEVEQPKQNNPNSYHEPANTHFERIAKGQSEAIAVRTPDGRGFFPVDLWEIFLRIIGLSRVAAQNSAESFRQSTSNVMIV